YGRRELAGKKAHFVVKVVSVLTSQLPELNEAFAEKLGVKEGGVETLRQEIRVSMVRNLEQNIHARIKEQVMDTLLEANPITLPSSLVEGEAQTLFEKTKTNLLERGVK